MNPIILKLAKDDLKEIHDRLVEFGDNPPQKFKKSFKTFCSNVMNTPYMYPPYDVIPKYRRAVIEYDYLVFYQVEKTGGNSKVKIYRVLHGKRDVPPLIDAENDY